MDCQVKARGPGHPHVNPPAQQPFRFDHPRGPLYRMPPGMVALTINHHHIGPKGARSQ